MALPALTDAREGGTTPGDITRLLHAWSQGDESAADEAIELLYPVLRRLAAKQLASEPGDITLQATELAHEAYLRLAGDPVDWQSRDQFFAITAKVLRRILVDHARRKRRLKRGGPEPRLRLDAALLELGDTTNPGVLDLHDALLALSQSDAKAAEIVELRYFGGLSIEETANAIGSSRVTVIRKWRTARAWLRQVLGGGAAASRS